MFGYKSFLRLGKSEKADSKEVKQNDYELLNLSHEFHQDIDEKGKVLSDVKGGAISLLIDGFPSQELINWGVESRIYCDGEIVIVDADNNILEKIEFKHGACIFFKIHYTNTGKAYCATKMEISAQTLHIGSQMKIDKSWKL